MKLYVDAMLGKLGNYLRLLGFDTLIADDIIKDHQILAKSIEEERILITRDKELYSIAKRVYREKEKTLPNLPNNHLLIKNDDLTTQLATFFEHFNIKVDQYTWKGKDVPFVKSRCTKCNAEINQVEKADILDDIHSKTAKHYQIFFRCQNEQCQQIYWVGRAHWKNIIKTIERAKEKMEK